VKPDILDAILAFFIGEEIELGRSPTYFEVTPRHTAIPARSPETSSEPPDGEDSSLF
jgi:hypothetical protein